MVRNLALSYAEQVGSGMNGVTLGESAGFSVDISDDGSRVIIGAPKDNHAYVYDRSGNNWVQVGSTLVGASSSELGYSVAISGDGNRIIVGARGSDSVYVYELVLGAWTSLGLTFPLTGRGTNRYGQSVAINSDGSKIMIGEPQNGSGLVHVKKLSGGDWVNYGYVSVPLSGQNSGDFFGNDVGINSDGSRIIVGASHYATYTGRAYIYYLILSGGTLIWTQVTNSPISGSATWQALGRSVAISSNGSRVGKH
jgi:hypothetical protein